MSTNHLLSWGLALAALVAGYVGWGWPGLVLAVTVLVFWLLLEFSRALRVMRMAAGRPKGVVDSAVMLHLAAKAFHPGKPLFPLLHVDTTWKFRDMYALRDKVSSELGFDLIVHKNPDAEARGINPFDHGSAPHPDPWKTEGPHQALSKYGFEPASRGPRREASSASPPLSLLHIRRGRRSSACRTSG